MTGFHHRLQNIRHATEDGSHGKGSDKATSTHLEALEAELQHTKRRAVAAEEKARVELQHAERRVIAAEEKVRRQQELYEAESLKKAETNRSLLQETKALLEQPKHTVGFQSMDDATCENLIRDVFHLLKTWCFSNFQDNTSSAPRLQIQAEIGAILVEEILSPLVIGFDRTPSHPPNRGHDSPISRTC